MARKIDNTECAGCGNCQRVCIVGCIVVGNNEKRRVNDLACVDCGACELICPKKCIFQS